ncbi:unnamed protein product, partial [Meganyctiphanes norvegica]
VYKINYLFNCLQNIAPSIFCYAKSFKITNIIKIYYTFSYFGQPRATEENGENCVAIEDDRGEGPGLKVEPCFSQNYFICNYMKDYRKGHDIFMDTMFHMNEIDSERFGKEHKGRYGKTILIEDRRLSWQEARDRCRYRGGDLHVPQKIGDLVDYMRKLKLDELDIWIGYNDHGENTYSNSFEGIHGNMIFEGWQKDEPRVHTPGDDCVAVEDDQENGAGLKVEPCYEQHLYACDLSTDFMAPYNTRQ